MNAALPATLQVVSPGVLTLVQDLGRPGWFGAGVGISGAADRASLIAANRLVGNEIGAACLEIVLGGLRLTATSRVMVAVTGATAPITVDGAQVFHHSPIILAAREQLSLGIAPAGLRCYLAVRGGIAVPPVLGSRSRDTLAGIGPEACRRGDRLPIGPPPATDPNDDLAVLAVPKSGPLTVRVLLGPRDDWFIDPRALFAGTWTVSTRADRVGMRLDRGEGDPPLRRIDDRELPTEGMTLGAIQVPPNGKPVIFLADHPITGGYPVLATVIDADMDEIGQARPGQRLIFTAPAGSDSGRL